MIDLKSYAIYTNHGPHLNLNEDGVEMDLANKLLLIADGYGGSNIGDFATKFVLEHILKNYSKITVDPDSTLPFFYSSKYLIEGNAILNALFSAHQKMYKQNLERNIGQRGGVSLIVGAFSENILTLVSTGTCYAGLVRNGKMIRPLIPDSLDLENLNGNSVFVPSSGIGLFEDLTYQVKELKINSGDVLILLTDGIYAHLNEQEIVETVLEFKEKDELILNKLIMLSNANGNLDNQSGIVLHF